MINTHDEVIKYMGEEVGSFFFRLLSEYQTIREIWSEYVELFVEKEEKKSHVVLLNKAAAFFFCFVQDSFLRVVCMGICRLTDPPEGSRGKYEYITIQRLPNLIMEKELESVEEKELEVKKKEIAKKIQPLKDLKNKALKNAEFARELRNKSFAHTDKVDDPEPGSLAKIRIVLEAIAAVLKAVQDYYGVKINHVDHRGNYYGRAFSLINVLELGLKAEKEGYYIDIDEKIKG